MNKENGWDVLTSTDYQKISAIINWLNNCQTRNEFNQAIQTAILPLITCNGAFYGRLPTGLHSLQLLGSINQSNCCPSGWNQFLISTLQKAPADSILESTPNTLPAITMASSTLPCQSNLNCQQHTSYSLSLQPHRICSFITLFDDHQSTYQLYFCQLDEKQQIFNQRDVELLKLLRPVLLQTLRFILFREESLHPRQTGKFWADNTEPIIVIRNNGTVLFQSDTFTQHIEREKHSFLATVSALMQFVQSNQIGEYNFLSKLGKRLYEIKLTLICADTNYQHCIYFLHLSRVTYKIGKIFNRLNRTGLTSRELEIATLIYQGNSSKEIAQEINLSYHTVRNHIKQIYKKLGVSTRSEMLVKLT